MSGVNVLAVLDRAAESAGMIVKESNGDFRAVIYQDDLFKARAAIAELIEACKARDWAEGLAIQADLENGHGLCPEKAYAASVAATQANLRYYAALAAVSPE